MDGNPEYESLKNKRDIRYKDFTPDDIIPGFSKVVNT